MGGACPPCETGAVSVLGIPYPALQTQPQFGEPAKEPKADAITVTVKVGEGEISKRMKIDRLKLPENAEMRAEARRRGRQLNRKCWHGTQTLK